MVINIIRMEHIGIILGVFLYCILYVIVIKILDLDEEDKLLHYIGVFVFLPLFACVIPSLYIVIGLIDLIYYLNKKKWRNPFNN